MNRALDLFTSHWFAGALLLLTLLLSGIVARLWWREGHRPPLLLLACALGLLALGGLALPAKVSLWLTLAATAILFVMLAIVILSSNWWAPLGYAAGAVLLLGLGGLCLAAIQSETAELYAILRTFEPTQLWWLLLLVLVPVVIVLSFRSLSGLGPVRRGIAIGLRCTLIVLLSLALAEVRASHHGDTTTVIFVVDVSHSMPEQNADEAALHPDAADGPLGAYPDISEFFLNRMAEMRESSKYQVGAIFFGAQPRLVRSATDAPRINVKYKDGIGNIDRNYTNIGSALKLALASFPEGTSKRIVLLSDGNENLGSAEEQAQLARINGVQIDVVPIGAGRRKENEVLVESIDAPAEIEEGAPLLIQVSVRSFNPNLVEGRLAVQQRKQRLGLDEWVDVAPPRRVQLRAGQNRFEFRRERNVGEKDKQGSYTFQARFTPERLLTREGKVMRGPDGKPIEGLPGDLPQNNTATTHVIARRDKSRVLLLEPVKDEFKLLDESLPTPANPARKDNPKFLLDRIPVSALPSEERLGAFLSGYDCVILANLPASSISEGQQKILRSNTHDQGCGLIMIGGPNSFGAGAWQDSAVEEALPVDTNIKSLKVAGKVGLVLIMHASEMMKGNYWQKQIAKTAIKELGDGDEVGILYYDIGGMKWHINLQPVSGDNRELLLAKVDSLSPGDMPDFDPGLTLAHGALKDKPDLSARHVIVITDGDPVIQNDANLNQNTVLQGIKADKITVTTVGVATHGASLDDKLKRIADFMKGRFYSVKNPNALPAIYLKETRIISQDFIWQNKEKALLPVLAWQTGPTENLKEALPGLHGFVRTVAKPRAVMVPIETPEIAGQRFPILAYWHYGLGKSVAYTSDASEPPGVLFWSRKWFDAGLYGKFWEQVIDWSLRPVESKRLTMATETRDGKTRVTVTARDDKDRPINNLNLEGGVTTPNSQADDRNAVKLEFKQTNSGTYEAEIKAEEAGSYFINASAVRMVKKPRLDKAGKPILGPDGKPIEDEIKEVFDSVRGGVTVSYSPEFAEVESNPILLEKLRDLTGGMTIPEERLQGLFDHAVRGGKIALADPNAKRPSPEIAAQEAKLFDDEARSLARDVYRTGPPSTRARQPIWFWLLFLTGVLLFFDVAVRRISVDPRKAVTAAQAAWERLRGREARQVHTPEFLDRLRSRKAQVGAALGKVRSERRFDGPEAPAAPPPGATETPAQPSPAPGTRPPSRPKVAPDTEEDKTDFGSRLLRAKKKVWEEREKEKEKDKDKEP